MKMETSQYKMTYYVGAMLAHGGLLTIKEDCLVFSPGTLERAMGATDTAIPFTEIKLVEVTGTITESLMVRTQQKSHRFVGSEPYKIRDKISSAIHNAYQQRSSSGAAVSQGQPPASSAAPRAPSVAAAPTEKTEAQGKCSACAKAVRSEFNFCPFCQAVLKASCAKCYKPVEREWKFCAFCKSSL